MDEQQEDLANLMQSVHDYVTKHNTQRYIHTAKSKMNAEISRASAALYGDKEQHLTWTIANEAYSLILDENLSAKDALIQAAGNHTEEVEAVLSEKSRNSGGMNKSIVKNHDKHPVQKDMTSHKKFNRQGMKNTNNVWQMLNLLSYFREAYKEALDLEKVKDDVATLQTEVMLAQEEIKNLQQNTGSAAMTLREKASLLKRKGHTQTSIGKVLCIHRSTVNRWWKNL